MNGGFHDGLCTFVADGSAKLSDLALRSHYRHGVRCRRRSRRLLLGSQGTADTMNALAAGSHGVFFRERTGLGP